MSRVLGSAKQVDFAVGQLKNLTKSSKVLLIKPEFFEVKYSINEHMKKNIGKIDKPLALQQWNILYETFHRYSFEVLVMPGHQNYPDMVFCANQFFFVNSLDRPAFIPSKMNNQQRAGEVDLVTNFLLSQGLEKIDISYENDETFEGMGDALWHHNKKLIWGGYGFRTKKSIYAQIANKLHTDILTLELINPNFYHLDTCLCILNDKSALIAKEAFTKEGIELIYSVFSNVIEAPEVEAKKSLAVNAVSLNGKDVVIQSGNIVTEKKLKKAGFNVIPVDTSEFLKSGGSIFCMKHFL